MRTTNSCAISACPTCGRPFGSDEEARNREEQKRQRRLEQRYAPFAEMMFWYPITGQSVDPSSYEE